MHCICIYVVEYTVSRAIQRYMYIHVHMVCIFMYSVELSGVFVAMCIYTRRNSGGVSRLLWLLTSPAAVQCTHSTIASFNSTIIYACTPYKHAYVKNDMEYVSWWVCWQIWRLTWGPQRSSVPPYLSSTAPCPPLLSGTTAAHLPPLASGPYHMF